MPLRMRLLCNGSFTLWLVCGHPAQLGKSRPCHAQGAWRGRPRLPRAGGLLRVCQQPRPVPVQLRLQGQQRPRSLRAHTQRRAAREHAAAIYHTHAARHSHFQACMPLDGQRICIVHPAVCCRHAMAGTLCSPRAGVRAHTDTHMACSIPCAPTRRCSAWPALPSEPHAHR